MTEIIKEQFATLLSDLGIIGWAVISIYAAMFGFSMIRFALGLDAKSVKARQAAKREETRARLDEIRLRLAEIRLAREEAAEKARLAREEAAALAQQQMEQEAAEKEEAWREDLALVAAEWEQYCQDLSNEETVLSSEMEAANDELANDEQGAV